MQDEFDESYAGEDQAQGGLSRFLSLYMKWGGAAVSVALVCLFVLWAYRLGVRDAAEIPVIRALDGPMRVQPEDPGGQVAENQGLEVNEILAGEEAQRPRETQLAPATLTLSPDDTPAEDGATANVSQPPEEGIDTAALVPLPDDEVEPTEEPATDIAGLIAALNAEEGVDTDGASAPPSLRPRPRPEGGTAAPPETPATSTPDAGRAQPTDIAPGTLLVQLGAFDSREIADTQWQLVVAAQEDLLGGRQRFVQRAESNGRVFYRLRVLGFNDRTEQRALCDALIAREVDCIPVTAR